MKKRSSKKVTVILVVLCLLFGSVGFAPELASTTGSPVAKAKVKKYTRYVKTSTLKVHKKASASSKVVVTLKKDKKVTQYGSANKKGWVKIRYKKNQYGYVKRNSLSKQVDIESLEAKAIKKIKAAAEEYGWTVLYEHHNPGIDEDGIKWINSACCFENSKYRIEISIGGDGSDAKLTFYTEVYYYATDNPKAREIVYSVKDIIANFFKKYNK